MDIYLLVPLYQDRHKASCLIKHMERPELIHEFYDQALKLLTHIQYPIREKWEAELGRGVKLGPMVAKGKLKSGRI